MANETGNSNSPDSSLSEYWKETARPIVCLVFVTPLLILYEGGVVWLGADAMRNGVDAWLRFLLEWIGFGQYFLLPLLTGCILLAWQHASGQRWRFRISVLGAMAIESVVYALVLLMLARVQGTWLATPAAEIACSANDGAANNVIARMIAFCGAGIYEELFFRLMLLPVTVAVIRACGANKTVSLIIAIALTSLLFSSAHYLAGEEFQWYSFVFRLSAGVFFSLLFIFRGFGIAVGAHALYDVFASLFSP